MKIVFVATECVPLASTGGLGDVTASLPHAMAEHGHDLVRIMPLFRSVREGGFKLERLDLTLDIPVGLESYTAEVYRTRHDGIDTYLIRRDEFYDRSYLYSIPHRDYEDNPARFVFFQKAAVELMDVLGVKADIVHAHDWQTGLIPFYLEHGIRGIGRAGGERCIFTIHNLAYQGVFPGSSFALTGLPFSTFRTEGGMEYYGQLSFMKAGIVGADIVTTVSPTYAQEIQTEGGGFGLHGVLGGLGHRLVGILNGIDTGKWDPSSDPNVKQTYTLETLEAGKASNKSALQHRVGLPRRRKIPLVGMVARLTHQKGIDLLADSMPELMEMDLQFALLGDGEEKYHLLCEEWRKRWPKRFSCVLSFDAKLAHLMYAGCDFMLVPSEFEPCGLNQMYGMRYGTIPVVHKTGGLADTVFDPSDKDGDGTGFVFTPYEAPAFLDAMFRACATWQSEAERRAMQRQGMARDSSWSVSAAAYEALYQRA